ncbi:MAG: hypothetical protein A2091_03630 [Desulfuromonadales bacterium GWD2_61_12]|nr:MAG: hypothetical protein A2005_06530 [Desulfuromonadales bacterium GWC2_61_20]OGR35900.1 MAG: hypothetical protein A2091_03630 [Desulfuromonadales bacterium GWD2_61_12]HAD05235.1 hypothetical protein [Desulfuromonas sp.]HBT83700.1 hypothetical protein [Desulfuromonas sp.]
MNSIEIFIVVEGPTEQTFVRDVLAPQMAHKGIFLYPALIGKPGHKGGDIRFDKAKNDIGNFLKQRNDTYITTMFDYFRIDTEWPGRAEVLRRLQNGTTLTASHKAEILEGATRNEIMNAFPGCDAETRFVPYIEMHEFEALLFSDADILAEKTEIKISLIRKIIEVYDNPEEINDDPTNAPGKRLESLKSGYRKVAMGKSISEAIGIQSIRKQCPHFNDWLTKLELLK